MSDSFCKAYTDKIFSKYDKNRSNVLDRSELKFWLRQEMANTNTPFKKNEIR